MAKPLSTAMVNPLSRLLDPAAAMRAVVPPQPSTMPEQRQSVLSQSQSGTRAAVPSFVKRECVLTRPTDEALTRLTEVIRRTTGARVSASHAVRCLLLVLGPIWPRLEDELRALGPMRLPSNAKGNEHARDALERTLASALRRATASAAGLD